MKKWISVILSAVILLGLCACGGTGEEKGEEGLQIGFAKENITPNFTVGISGYGDAATRKNTDGYLDYIYVSCIAAKEGDETILLYTMDTSAIGDARAEGFRAYLSEAVGIPGSKMFFGATHTHNGPDNFDEAYAEWIKDKMIKVTQNAIADLSAATVSATSTQATGMTFIRHYKMTDGSYAGANFGDWSLTPVSHTAEADEEMQIVKFDRADESKKDIVLVNFQAHNDHAQALGYNTLSAGYVGALRDELSAKSGCEVAFFMGASGDLNHSSKITSENHNLPCKEYGAKLGQIAFEAMNNLEPVGGSGIAVANYQMDAEVDHSWDSKLDQAKEVNDLWQSAGKDAANNLGKTYGFSSCYHAKAVITRSDMEATVSIGQGAFRIHDVAFVTAPYEMFAVNGMTIKGASPYQYTLIVTACSGYIPSKAAYEYRSYESDTGYFVEGVAEKLQDKYIEMLGSIQ